MAYFYSGLWVFCKAYCSIYSSFFSKDMHGFPGKSFHLGLLRFLLVGISIYLGWNLISDPTALTRCVMRKNGVLVVRLSFLALCLSDTTEAWVATYQLWCNWNGDNPFLLEAMGLSYGLSIWYWHVHSANEMALFFLYFCIYTTLYN